MGNAVKHVNFIYAGGAHGGNAFAARVITDDGVADSYFSTDHLGSTMLISDEKGHVANASGADATILGYDAWGSRRNPDGQPAAAATFNLQVGHREFTGQETIPNVGLVNMNGRVYDPAMGRFLSPDPNVQFPANLQSYNRYSYVLNNPLSVNDPTGYFLGLSGLEWFDIGATIAAIAACSGPQAAACGMIFSLAVTAANVADVVANGGSQNQIAATAILGGSFGFVGGAFGGAAADIVGGGIAGQIVGGVISTTITTTLATVFSGGQNLGENLIVALSEGALAAGASYALAQLAPVSEASAAQTQRDNSNAEGGWADDKPRSGPTKDTGYRAQDFENDCVPAATKNAIKFRTEVEVPADQIRREVDPNHGSWDKTGVDPKAAIPVLEAHGVKASVIQVEKLSDLVKASQNGPLLVGGTNLDGTRHRIILLNVGSNGPGGSPSFRVLDSLSANFGQPIGPTTWSYRQFSLWWNPNAPTIKF